MPQDGDICVMRRSESSAARVRSEEVRFVTTAGNRRRRIRKAENLLQVGSSRLRFPDTMYYCAKLDSSCEWWWWQWGFGIATWGREKEEGGILLTLLLISPPPPERQGGKTSSCSRRGGRGRRRKTSSSLELLFSPPPLFLPGCHRTDAATIPPSLLSCVHILCLLVWWLG